MKPNKRRIKTVRTDLKKVVQTNEPNGGVATSHTSHRDAGIAPPRSRGKSRRKLDGSNNSDHGYCTVRMLHRQTRSISTGSRKRRLCSPESAGVDCQPKGVRS